MSDKDPIKPIIEAIDFYKIINNNLSNFENFADFLLSNLNDLENEMNQHMDMLDNLSVTLNDIVSEFSETIHTTKLTLKDLDAQLSDQNSILFENIDAFKKLHLEKANLWLDNAQENIKNLSKSASDLSGTLQKGNDEMISLLTEVFSDKLQGVMHSQNIEVMTVVQDLGNKTNEICNTVDISLGDISHQLEPVADMLDSLRPGFDIISSIA